MSGLFGGTLQIVAAHPRSDERWMKIATFNINNIKRRLPNLLQWLKASKPDVVCLQGSCPNWWCRSDGASRSQARSP
jgi:hypothetical protein